MQKNNIKNSMKFTKPIRWKKQKSNFLNIREMSQNHISIYLIILTKKCGIFHYLQTF